MTHFFKKIQGWFSFPNLYKKLVNDLPQGATFVEVGVWKGKSLAFFIVECINQGKNINVFAVDTWLGCEVLSKDKDVINGTVFDIFVANLAPVSDLFKIIRKTSVDASLDFDNESIDAIFIDAGHSYESVSADIKAWYPKLKSGGFFSGHDYNNQQFKGVNKAVNEFIEENKPTVINLGDEGSWIVRKP